MKFKEGDKVRIIRDEVSHLIPLGTLVTISGFYSSDGYDVEGYNSFVSEKDVESIHVKATAKPKNLILKKNLPSSTINGNLYTLKKGTVFFNNGSTYEIVKGLESNFTEEYYETNKDFFGLTVKKHTYEVYKINGDEVKFEEGCIKVGCQTIPNDVVKAIAKNLIG